MPIIKKANLKCPNKNCNSTIYREWNVGVIPKLLSVGSLYFKCRKCSSIIYVSVPLYMVSKFLEVMESDKSLIYIDGEWLPKIEEIDEEEIKIFMGMLQQNPTELLTALSQIEKIDLNNYEKE